MTFVVDLGEKGKFYATAPPPSGDLPPMAGCCKKATDGTDCGCKDGQHETDDASTLRFIGNLWTRAREGKMTEHARLRMLEKLYRGIHYEDLEQGNYKRLEVTNFCFANVETVSGVFNRQKAMPRVNPTKAMDSAQALKLREIANWWVNKSKAGLTRSLANRTKVKFGYTILLLTIDPTTGFPYVNNWSPWDFYPDPSAKDVSGSEYFIFGAPIPTTRLRAMFPAAASKIKPDNYVSPSWDVTKRIDQQLFYDQWLRNLTLPAIQNDLSTAPTRSNPQPTGSTMLAPDRAYSQRRGSETTFFFQVIVRDRTQQTMTAMGKRVMQSPVAGDSEPMETADSYSWPQPACPSGFRVFYATADTLLGQCPLDPCYGGLNFAIDYYTRHEGRFEGISEIEQLAPMQRAYNERKNMLNRGLRLAAAPVLKASKGSGINWSRRTIEAGDVLEHAKGSDIEWLEYQGPNAQQFQHLETEKLDMELVTGTNRTLSGVQPEGTRTGVQLRELQSAAAGRIQAKMPESLAVWAEILVKACKIMQKKLIVPITFKATNGEMMAFSAGDLDGEYTFDFPVDETDLDADEKAKNDAMTLFQLGLIDREEALKTINWPGWADVAQRMMMVDMQKAQMEAQARAESLNKAGDSKKEGAAA